MARCFVSSPWRSASYDVIHRCVVPRRRVIQGLTLLTLLSLTMIDAPASSLLVRVQAASSVGAVRKLMRDKDPARRAAAIRRLAGDSSSAAVSCVWDALADPHPYVRGAAVGVLALIPEGPSRQWTVRKWRKEKRVGTKAAALDAFLLWGEDVAHPHLVAALKSSRVELRRGAIRSWFYLACPQDLGSSASERTQAPTVDPSPMRASIRQALSHALGDQDGSVRAWALRALVVDQSHAFTNEHAVDAPMLARLQRGDSDARVRLTALESSVALGGEVAVVAILHGLNDAVWSVRLRAAELAGTVRARAVLEALPEYLDDERMRVSRAVHHALVELSGIPFEPSRAKWMAWINGDGATYDPALAPPASSRRLDATKRLRKGTVTGERTIFLDLTLVSRHVAIVLDRSGSMREPWADMQLGASVKRGKAQAKKHADTPRRRGGKATDKPLTRWRAVTHELNELLLSLKQSGPGAVVNVVVFGNEAESVFPHAKKLDGARVRTIKKWLEGTEPAGRTALYDGVAMALADPRVDNVIVLSDGAPSAGSYFTKTALLRAIREANHWRRARIDVIAIGSSRVASKWRDLLRRVARESGGICLSK